MIRVRTLRMVSDLRPARLALSGALSRRSRELIEHSRRRCMTATAGATSPTSSSSRPRGIASGASPSVRNAASSGTSFAQRMGTRHCSRTMISNASRSGSSTSCHALRVEVGVIRSDGPSACALLMTSSASRTDAPCDRRAIFDHQHRET